jgi:hypothetical protein
MSWKTRILVVANVTADSDALLAALRERLDRGPASFVLLVPATGGGPEGRAAAGRSLEAALGRMREAGLDVDGEVGDADPVAAVSDVCHPGEFDEIVVSTLPAQASKWLLGRRSPPARAPDRRARAPRRRRGAQASAPDRARAPARAPGDLRAAGRRLARAAPPAGGMRP